MPVYFIETVDDWGRAEDEHGFECDTLDRARNHALEGIRSLLSNDLLGGHLDLNGYVSILDVRRSEIETVQYEDALTIVPRRPYNGT